jgi:hypothetical protein
MFGAVVESQKTKDACLLLKPAELQTLAGSAKAGDGVSETTRSLASS